jgi:hypothetical protein
MTEVLVLVTGMKKSLWFIQACLLLAAKLGAVGFYEWQYCIATIFPVQDQGASTLNVL